MKPSSNPKITVITPSYNQGRYLEETICSVLSQEIRGVEFLVIDGGSQDESVEIIKRYADQIDWWVSERDLGQSDAINKGFNRAQGDIVCWLNSDDIFYPKALETAIEILSDNPQAVACIGVTNHIDTEGNIIRRPRPRLSNRDAVALWDKDAWFDQPAVFMRRSAVEKAGLLRTDLHNVLDVEYWTRLMQFGEMVLFDQVVAASRIHKAAKTYQDIPQREAEHLYMLKSSGFEHLIKKRYEIGVKHALGDASFRQKILVAFGRKELLARLIKSVFS